MGNIITIIIINVEFTFNTSRLSNYDVKIRKNYKYTDIRGWIIILTKAS